MSDLIDRQAAIDALEEPCKVPDTWSDEFAVGEREQWEKDVKALKNLPSAQPEQQHGRVFKEIVVEYPAYSTYPEHKGKPYFSIKYTENGQEFIGYGTYKPEVLSEYLKEFFMFSAQPERKKGEWNFEEYPDGHYHSECSECGQWFDESAYLSPYNFCPNCGADMRGEQDE